MAKDKDLAFKSSASIIGSIILHSIFFGLLFTTVALDTKKPPITINLQQDPGNAKKIVQATLIDKRSADLVAQKQAYQEKLQRQKIIAQQQKIEQEKLAAVQAQQVAQEQLEATKQAALKLKQETELQIKQQVAAQQTLLRKQALDKLQAAQQAEKQKASTAAKHQANVAAKQQAAKAAAVKAQHDRIVAEHQALVESEVEKYRAEFAAAIEENRILSGVFAPNLQCKLRIMLLPDGSIMSVKVLESSGNPAFDDLSASAVYKSAPFEMPQDQELFAQLRDIVLAFKNGE